MHNHTSPYVPAPCRSTALPLSHPLSAALALAALPDAIETAAEFGRWWLDPETAQLVLSNGAAALLDVDVGLHSSPGSDYSAAMQPAV